MTTLHSLPQLFCWRCRREYWKTKCRSAGGHEWSCRASIIHSTWLIHICRDWEVAGQGVFGPAARSWLLVLLLRPQRFPLLGLRKNSNWAWRVNRFSVEVSLKPQRFHTCSFFIFSPPVLQRGSWVYCLSLLREDCFLLASAWGLMHKASSSTPGWVKMRYGCSQKRVGLLHCCYRKYLSHFIFFNLQFEMQFSRNIYIYLIVRMRFLFLFFFL